jgi:hypothetical protein
MTTSSTEALEVRQVFRRYADSITALLRPAVTERPELAASDPSSAFAAEDADRLQVERGAVFGRFLLDPASARCVLQGIERLLTVASPTTLSRIQIVDRAGHARPVYRPLLVYAWLRAYQIGYEVLPRGEFGRWDEALRVWCDDLESRLGGYVWPPNDAPAGQGDLIAEVCWIALALQVAGKIFIRDAWTDLAADVFGKLSRRQCDTGAFLTTTPADNPETYWFHELAILHAAATFAVQSEDRALAASVARATQYHLNETQPDHATAQPWGLFAFIWNAPTQSVADGMLHSVATIEETGATRSGISLMLLADSLYCLQLFY